MRYKVKDLSIGDHFKYEDHVYVITAFPTRYTVVGDNIKPESGSPSSCKVPVREATKVTLDDDADTESHVVVTREEILGKEAANKDFIEPTPFSFKDRIFIALDTPDIGKAIELVDSLSPYTNCFKIGLELFYAYGPLIFSIVKDKGKTLFFDSKLADIPTTVAKATKTLELPDFINAHCFTEGSVREAALAASTLPNNPKVFGVTILTSATKAYLTKLGLTSCPASVTNDKLGLRTLVINMALQAQCDGAYGVVSAARDVPLIKEFAGVGFNTIVPGVRPPWADNNDQKRTATPKQAFDLGADYIVIGRPVTDPPKRIGEPHRAMEIILNEIGA